MLENYHHQPRKDQQLNVEYLNTDYEIRVKKFNDYAEIVRKEKQRIKEMEIEYKLLKELIQKNPVLDEMAKQVQVIYNFFDNPTPTPKKQRVKKLTKEQEFQKLIEEQEKKIELMEMAKMVKEGKLSI